MIEIPTGCIGHSETNALQFQSAYLAAAWNRVHRQKWLLLSKKYCSRTSSKTIVLCLRHKPIAAYFLVRSDEAQDRYSDFFRLPPSTSQPNRSLRVKTETCLDQNFLARWFLSLTNAHIAKAGIAKIANAATLASKVAINVSHIPNFCPLYVSAASKICDSVMV